MKSAVKKTAIFVALAITGGLALTAWWLVPGRRTEVRLAPVSPEPVPRAALATEPIYRQSDPKWAGEQIGGSGESLRRVGCTICCLSMALAHHGVMADPGELNRKLKAADGYTYRGWVKWEALRRISAERVTVEIPQNPSHRDIDSALAEGNPVLVKVVLRSAVQHWVLLVGRDQQEYLMKDPMGDGRSLQVLSSLGSDILAVRVVRSLKP
jgi:Peptidase C39 family